MKKRKSKRIKAKPLPTRKLLNNTTTTIMPIHPSGSTYFSIYNEDDDIFTWSNDVIQKIKNNDFLSIK
jgi:hypothetical protein